MKPSHLKFYEAISKYPNATITRKDLVHFCEANQITYPTWFANDPNNRISHGVYVVPRHIPETKMNMAVTPMPTVENLHEEPMKENNNVVMLPAKNSEKNHVESIETDLQTNGLIPEVNKGYVPFGNFKNLLRIVASGKFFPVFLSGHSGNGKTMSIEQACAKAKRKFVIVSMTPDTDESDLLGNYVLVDGKMLWRDGPVTTAAREGAVLCIDEIDYGTQNLSCLQRVLEGKPFLLKKKGELVTPADGFTIFATANTKGRGSEDGRYMFTNILNEAFLERFLVTMDQDWPTNAIEIKILEKRLKTVEHDFEKDPNYAKHLVTWADTIRKTFNEHGCDEVVSTRRLVHIVDTYGIFKNKKLALELCLNRFDADTKASFVDLYNKLEPSSETPEVPKSEDVLDYDADNDPTLNPF